MKEVDMFLQEYRQGLDDGKELLYYVLANHHNRISQCDISILLHLASHGFIIRTTHAKLAKDLKVSYRHLFCRLVYLKGMEIVETQSYDRLKVIYLHPKVVRRWTQKS